MKPSDHGEGGKLGETGKRGERVTRLNGILKNYNYSPKGGVDGFIVDEKGKGLAQVNVRPEFGAIVAAALKVGEAVKATAETDKETSDHNKSGHPVYRLVSLSGKGAEILNFEEGGENVDVEVTGIVARFNYSLDGKANGVILDSGDFIHLKPRGMARSGLEVGAEVKANGKSRPTILGKHVIAADVVNGTKVGKRPHH